MGKKNITAGVSADRPPLPYTLNLYFIMLALSFTVSSTGTLVPVFTKYFGLSLSDGGLVVLAQGLGGTLGTLLGAIVSDRVKKPLFIKITLISFLISVFALSVSASYIFVLIFWFLIGGFCRMCDAAINAWIALLHRRSRERFVSLLHVFFGVGAVAGPLLAVSIINAELDWNFVFVILGCFGTLVMVSFLFMKPDVQYADKPQGEEKAAKLGEFIKIKRLIPVYLATFFQTGLFVGSATWSPTYMQDILKTGVVLSGLPTSILWCGIVAGRLIVSTVGGRLDIRKMLIYTNVATAVATLVAFLGNNPVVFIIMYGVIGILSGAMMPLSITIVSDWYPRNTGTASSLISTFGSAGQMVFPYVLGLIAEAAGFMTAMYLLCVFPLLTGLMFVLIKYKRSAPEAEAAATPLQSAVGGELYGE